MLFWDDLTPGSEFPLGRYVLSHAEMIEFAKRYDPQAFHIDRSLAESSPIGCLCASGMHTLAISQRLVYEALYTRCAVVAGAGIDKVRFHRPALPDEALSGRVFILSRDRSPVREKRGFVLLQVVINNRGNEAVLSMEVTIVVLSRPH